MVNPDKSGCSLEMRTIRTIHTITLGGSSRSVIVSKLRVLMILLSTVADDLVHGRVKDGYPGLSNFLTGKDGNDCPTCISLGPQGSYFISTGKTSSFKCHPNAPIDQEAAKASRLWWGFEGAYVMEREDKTLKMDLAGHYGGLGGLIDEKTERGWKIKVKDLAVIQKHPG